MKHTIKLIQSKNIYDYSEIMKNLKDDLGNELLWDILVWCGIINIDFDKNNLWEIFIIKNATHNIGISGLFTMNPSKDEIWLGWFGVYRQFRNNGLGSSVLDFLIKSARERGYKKMMVYTQNNNKATSLYLRKNFIKLSIVETYINVHPEKASYFSSLTDQIMYLDLHLTKDGSCCCICKK